MNLKVIQRWRTGRGRFGSNNAIDGQIAITNERVMKTVMVIQSEIAWSHPLLPAPGSSSPSHPPSPPDWRNGNKTRSVKVNRVLTRIWISKRRVKGDEEVEELDKCSRRRRREEAEEAEEEEEEGDERAIWSGGI